MAEKTQDISLQQGKTQPLVLRIETDVVAYRDISSIDKSAPARIVTTTPHGLVDGWDCVITNALGMTEINQEANKTSYSKSERKAVTVVDPTTVTLNKVNAVGFKAHTPTTGVLQYFEPMDLTGFDARMDIRDKKNGNTVLFSFTTANGLIAIDNALKTVTIYFDALDFTALTWKRGYYELELFKNITRGASTLEYVYSPIEGFIFLDVETTK